MKSLTRALPAALAVLVLALTLGLSSTFVTSSEAEAAQQPSPVAAPYTTDQDSCTTYVYGSYSNIYPFYGYNPYYQSPVVTYPCVSPAFCVGAYSTYYYQPYHLVCPGPPATIEVNQTSATCASATNIQAKVRDANGLNVLDGTSVSFSVTPFAQITGTVETNGGEATASLTTPTKTSGTLSVTITAGSITRIINVEVSCSAPGSVAYGGGGSSSSAPATVYVVPSGGSGGY